MPLKFKGKTVEVDGVVVATINGWRNPNGVDHVPYTARLVNGQEIGAFAYCGDARKWCRDNFSSLVRLVVEPAFDVKAHLGLL